MRHPKRSFAALLARAHRSRRWRIAAEGLLRWLGACVPGLAALFLLALILPPTQAWSAVMALVAGVGVIAGFAGWFLVPVLRPLPLSAYALWLEQRAHLPRNELINALQLEREAAAWHDDPVSRELVARSIERGERRLPAQTLRALHAERSLRPYLWRTLLGVLPFLAVASLSPLRFGDAASLFLSAGSHSVVPAIELQVEPGDVRVERGASVEIQATLAGRRRPAGARIEIRRPDGVWTHTEMSRTETDRPEEDGYRFLASALSGDIEYRVKAGWAASDTYRIRVLERLQAVGYRKHYESPAYTGVPPQREISSRGDLAALIGTRTRLEVRHRRPGATGRLLFADGGTRSLEPSGTQSLATTLELVRSGAYRVELADAHEGDLWVSDTFRIEVVPDLDPVVRLLSPGKRIDVPPDMYVNLVVDCVDDFGITELALVYGRPGDDPARRILASWEDDKEARVTFNWNLDAVQLLPGDEMHYFLQVYDNDPVRGPKVGETELFTIRFPSMAEMYANAEEERHEEITSLSDALDSQQELREELRKVAQEMLREEDISWERQQEIEDLLERQEALAQKVEQIQQSLAASQDRMENQNLFSMEMIEKVQEIQEVVAQIESEEFRQSLERMHDALENLDRRELQRAMEEMKITQEEMSQALDRTLQMLRQLLAEEKLDRILQKLDELAARQEEINTQLEMGAKPPEQGDLAEKQPSDAEKQPGDAEKQPSDAEKQAGEEAEKQSGEEKGECDRPMSAEEAEELAAQQEQLRKELEKLQEQLEKMQREELEGLDELSEALKEHLKDPTQKETLEQMQQAMEAMQNQQRSPSLKFGRKAKGGLQKMQASLSQMKQQMDVEKLEAIARALYNISNRMVRASQRQEDLLGMASRVGPRQMAVYQQELCDEVGVLGDSLFAVSRETRFVTREHLRAMGEILMQLEEARNRFEAGRRQSGVGLAGESSRSLDAAVKKLLEAACQAQQSSCASSCQSPFNRLQTLTNQQCSLNEQTKQQMMGMAQVPRSTMSQQESMMRLAARQEMIRQGLSEVREEMEGTGQLMGELGKAIQEMEDLVEQLRGRKAQRRIIERQERILSRLLSAQRSIRKREQSEQRLSRTAQMPAMRGGPDDVEMGNSRIEILQRAMLRGAQDPVPPEYRGMVDRYMRSLLRESR